MSRSNSENSAKYSIPSLLNSESSILRSVWFSLFLTVVISLTYGNTWFNGYSVDDNLIVDGNEQAEAGFSAVQEIFMSNYFSRGEKKGSYRALPRASFAIEVGLFGKNPGISHIINVALFLLTCILIVKLLTHLFPRGSTLAILLTVLIFALHPIHTEVVASLKNRDELFQLLFNLIACIYIVKYARSGSFLDLTIIGISFLAALASKESAVQFLAVFPFIFYYSGKVNRKRAIAASIVILATVGIFSSFMLLYLNPNALLWMDSANEEFLFIEHPLMHTESLSMIIGTGLYGLGYYLRLFLFPHPLGFFYGHNEIPIVPIQHPVSLLTLSIFLFLFIAATKGLKSKSPFSLGIFIMLICFAIFSNFIVQVTGIIAERFAYASSFGFCIVAGWSIQYIMLRSSTPSRKVISSILIIVFGIMGIATAQRNTQWKSYLTLADHDSKIFTESAITHLYLATYIQDHILDTATTSQAKWAEKISHELKEVVRIHPQSNTVCKYAIHRIGNRVSNEVMYEILFNTFPDQHAFDDLLGYGKTLLELKNYPKADTLLERSVSENPKSYEAHELYAKVLFIRGKTTELKELLLLIEKQFPNSELPAIYYGNLALKNNNVNLALEWFEKAVQLKPENSELKQFLIQQYKLHGKTYKASALESTPSNSTN